MLLTLRLKPLRLVLRWAIRQQTVVILTPTSRCTLIKEQAEISSFLLHHSSRPFAGGSALHLAQSDPWKFVRQQTPYRCQSRNHGLFASKSSCLRFAAARSLALTGLVSGTAKMRS